MNLIKFENLIKESINSYDGIWYHCTNKDSALKIMKEGFKFTTDFRQIFFARPADKDHGEYCIKVNLQSLNLVDLSELQKATSLWYATKDQSRFISYLKKHKIDGYWYGKNSTPTIPAECLVFSLNKLNKCPRVLLK